jgi:hypothetical protein
MNTRVEKKFIINNNLKTTDFIQLLNGNFKLANPPRVVNSIYFDSPDLKAFHENIEGLENRFKVRIRWYDNDFKNSKLEIKVKQGLFGHKLIYDLENFSADCNLYEYFRDICSKSVISKEHLPYIVNLIPISYNNYLRRYYESFNKKVRITVDSELKFKKLTNFYIPKTIQLRSMDYSIIEFKYKDSEQEIVSKILKNSPLVLRKFSKYTAGVLAN